MKARTILYESLVAAVALGLTACGVSRADDAAKTTTNPTTASHGGLPPQNEMLKAPLGHAAGQTSAVSALAVANPYEGNPDAIKTGRTLFVVMNCAGCHGYDARGAMGPNLTDRYWRYGGLPVQIYKSIYQGRPQGMAGWGNVLSPQDTWRLVAYIQSLGGTYAAANYHTALQGDQPGELVAPEVLIKQQQAQKPPKP